MSEQQETKKADSQSAEHSASTGKTKTLDELLHGFEEIEKIQSNQSMFKKSGSKPSFEKIKKSVSDHDTTER